MCVIKSKLLVVSLAIIIGLSLLPAVSAEARGGHGGGCHGGGFRGGGFRYGGSAFRTGGVVGYAPVGYYGTGYYAAPAGSYGPGCYQECVPVYDQYGYPLLDPDGYEIEDCACR